jgi:hypothetical protein
MNYESVLTMESRVCGGVRFTIGRMSFGRRIELARRVREISHKLDFAQAGNTPADSVEAAVITGEVDRVCIEWGLKGIEGLEIDGREATTQALIEAGPEDLCREIARAVKHECGLTEEERKN